MPWQRIGKGKRQGSRRESGSPELLSLRRQKCTKSRANMEAGELLGSSDSTRKVFLSSYPRGGLGGDSGEDEKPAPTVGAGCYLLAICFRERKWWHMLSAAR